MELRLTQTDYGGRSRPEVGREPPVIAFINSKSGGQQGTRVKRRLMRLLPHNQIFDLSEGGPEPGLRQWYSARQVLRVIACGGDGTVGWVLSVLDKLDWDEWPAVCFFFSLDCPMISFFG
eukprot:TRINITY_DN4655_c0_g3_i7.p1 TRINITY_DN4655_c0_g3~~TRINITY_DN4655_c0_g3_i7.p1  ORF type:complete len:120 (-),score=20.67 TRINITY_DN4655_c0_g3_i7:456-815(-)